MVSLLPSYSKLYMQKFFGHHIVDEDLPDTALVALNSLSNLALTSICSGHGEYPPTFSLVSQKTINKRLYKKLRRLGLIVNIHMRNRPLAPNTSKTIVEYIVLVQFPTIINDPLLWNKVTEFINSYSNQEC